MVLLGDKASYAAGLRSGLDINGFSFKLVSPATLREIFFNLCSVCRASVMSCIPPSAFTARHVRECAQHSQLAKVPSGRETPPKYYHTRLEELSPLKYNSKLMNSIWGLYNRYSPHNVKNNNVACAPAVAEMQPQAATSAKTESVPALTITKKLGNIWAATTMSQSH